MGVRLSEGEKLVRRLETLAKEAENVNDKLNSIYQDLTCYDTEDFPKIAETCKCCEQEIPESRDDVARRKLEMDQVEDFMSDMDSQAYNAIDTSYIDSAVETFRRLEASTQDALAKLVRV